MREILSDSVIATQSIAQSFAKELVGGDIVLLNGQLGAGKTAFVQGLAKGLGVKEQVVSPTYTILNIYRGESLELFHYDMYRIENKRDIYELGLDDYFYYNGVCVVEWNKAEELQTMPHYEINIQSTGDNNRRIVICKV